MSYVPIIVAHAASARAEDLAKRLEKSLDEYRRLHPTTSDMDVRQALQLVAQRNPGGTTATRVALALGVVMAVLGVVLFLRTSGLGPGGSIFGSGPFMIVAIGSLVLITAVIFGIKGGLGEGEQRPTVLVVSGIVLLLFLALASFMFLAYRG